MQPVLSVIIVAYKSRDEIGACLGSLARELDGRPVEVIVVDNSPGDGAVDIVRRDFPSVQYVATPENLGFGRANNLGFRRTSGECVLFLNPDTVSNARALGHCVRRLQAEPGIGLISPKLVLDDGSMDLACRRSIPTLWDGFCRATGLAAAFPHAKLFAGYNLTHLPAGETHDVGAINGAFMMARREVLEQVAEGPLACSTGLTSSGSATSEVGWSNTTTGETLVPSNMCILPVSGGQPLTTGETSLRPGAAAGRLPVPPEPRVSRPANLAVFDESFFMYGDDLDLCIRVARAGLRIVYDGRVQITHIKGVSVGKDYERMARAIFDANRDVYLKHFNPRGSRLVALKYRLTFGSWKLFARLRARISGYRRVKPI